METAVAEQGAQHERPALMWRVRRGTTIGGVWPACCSPIRIRRDIGVAVVAAAESSFNGPRV